MLSYLTYYCEEITPGLWTIFPLLYEAFQASAARVLVSLAL